MESLKRNKMAEFLSSLKREEVGMNFTGFHKRRSSDAT